MRRGTGIAVGMLCGLALGVPPAVAGMPAPPHGCTPSPLSATSGEVCFHAVLVSEVTNAGEHHDTVLSVTDGTTTRTARVTDWWSLGPATAGQFVTLWGQVDPDQTVRVTRWIELTHGDGPSPAGPYPLVRLIDAASGRLPQHRMVWTVGIPFAVIPQQEGDPYNGDGDEHVQLLTPCPGAGLTSETVPPLRGYVDRPLDLPSVPTGKDDALSAVTDAPPVGVPVMVLGGLRYDYGYGWWESHPIRAWRFPTEAQYRQSITGCAADPIPHLNPQNDLAPLPWGFPSCGEDPVAHIPLGACGRQCWVSHTAIGRLEQLSGDCQGVVPEPTPTQEQWLGGPNGHGKGKGGHGPPAGKPPKGGPSPRAWAGAGHNYEHRVIAGLIRPYGEACAGRSHAGGDRSAFSRCLIRHANFEEERYAGRKR